MGKEESGIDKLIREAREQREEMGFGGDDRPGAITDEGLEHLMRLAYNVSQDPDEGRYPRPRIHVRPAKAPALRSFAQFPDRSTVDHHLLRKLSPALARADMALVVVEERDALLMHGVGCLTDLATKPLTLHIDWARMPAGLTLTVRGPGRITYRERHVTLELASGAVTTRRPFGVVPTVASWLDGLAWGLLERLGETLGTKAVEPAVDQGALNLFLREVLAILFRMIAAHGHGGCVLVAPTETLGTDLEERYRVSGIDLLAACHDVAEHVCRKHGEGIIRPDRLEAWQAAAETLLDRLHATASFAQVDGCVLVDRGLCVRSFGNHIKAEVQADAGLRFFEGFQREATRRQWRDMHLGTRHTSALAFCRTSAFRLGFVLSQDGRFHVLGFDEREPSMWQVDWRFSSDRVE